MLAAHLCFAADGPGFVDLFTDVSGQYAGKTIMPLLSMPEGARAAVMGHAITALGADATASMWNPACLGLLRRHEFSLTHSEMMLGVRHETFAAAFPFEYLGAFAVRCDLLTSGSFRDSRDGNEVADSPTASDLLIGLSYGGALIPDHIYVGAASQVFQSRLADEDSRGIAGDFFMLLKAGSFRFAVGAKNLGPSITYIQEKEYLPSGVVVGLGQSFSRKRSFSWGLGAARYLGQPVEASIAAEFGLPYIVLRTGYTAAIDTTAFDPTAGLRLGIGFREQRYAADYGWERGPADLGSTHYISFSAAFKEIVPKTAEDYYRSALKHFKKGNYRRAIEESENALGVNPNLWKAHTLISESYSTLRKAAGLELTLIYTANLQGEIGPQMEGKGAVGGMARQATAIRQLRSQNPLHLVLDGGNQFTANTQPLKIDYMLKAASLMGYSTLGAGAGELGRGLEKVCYPAKKFGMAFTLTNAETPDMPSLVREQILHVKDKYKVAVFGVIGQKAKPAQPEGVRVLNLIAELRERMRNAEKADLRVVMADASSQEIHAIAKEFPQVDVILLSGSEMVYGRPQVLGKTLVLSPGARGRHVGALTLYFTENRQLLSYQHRMIRLSQEVAPDPEVEDLLHQLLIKTEMESTGEDLKFRQGVPSGMVLFVSDRAKTRNIYVKFMKRNTEFRLTSAPHDHFAPVYSPVNGKIAYIEQWTDSLGAVYRDLWTMELPGAKKKAVTRRERVSAAAWHPATGMLFFCSDSADNADIYRTGPEGEQRHNLTQTADADETGIIFSASGKEMVYVTNRDRKQQLYIAGADGSNPLRMTDEDCNHAAPQYSPDGRYLAYLSDKMGSGGKMDLAVVNLETNGTKYLTQNSNVRSFRWLPEDGKLVYEAGVNLTDLNLVRLSDGFAEKLLPTETIKDYSERNPRLVWFEGEFWILFEKAWETKSILHRVRLNGTDQRPCAVENPNNSLE